VPANLSHLSAQGEAGQVADEVKYCRFLHPLDVVPASGRLKGSQEAAMWDILDAVFWLAVIGFVLTGLYIRSGNIAGRFDGGSF
jgi:hypothetical protein